MKKWFVHGVIILFLCCLSYEVFVVGDPESRSGTFFYALGTVVMIGIYSAICFLLYVLPALTEKATDLVYSVGDEVEDDPLHDARACFAQGDYAGAIREYRKVAETDNSSRLAWVEIAKIQHDQLENPDAALATLMEAQQSHDWPVNDKAFFHFRMADIYEKDKDNAAAAIDLYQQAMVMFPETRHAANARHKLNELGVKDA
ncbi:tetratricopeptide repeat protein [Persicirhabdus sediminis]|uniref:Tetratricopeptide repeat-containing protein n=1 Tax=Persicirhabdus sediminis TaxID=454144 RepID=A0A8J7SM33_9BACT|nr:hypothetical protein [Persicirhabdus sediminis]MBK1790833.1 hypothetical protein [Persicirhabdus sediminis]